MKPQIKQAIILIGIVFFMLFVAAVPFYIGQSYFTFLYAVSGFSCDEMEDMNSVLDSLKAKFPGYASKKQFYSYPESEGYFVEMDLYSNTVIKKLKNDLKSGKPLGVILKKYQKYIGYKSDIRPIVKVISPYVAIHYFQVGAHTNCIFEGEGAGKLQLSGRHWIYSFTEYDSFTRLQAFYVTKSFKSRKLPKRYSDMIRYAWQLSDTTYKAPVIKNPDYAELQNKDLHIFRNMIDEDALAKYSIGAGINWGYYDNLFMKNPEYGYFLKRAVQTIADSNQFDFWVFQFANRYLDKSTYFEEIPKMVPYSFCNFDPTSAYVKFTIAKTAFNSGRYGLFFRCWYNSFGYGKVFKKFMIEEYLKDGDINFKKDDFLIGNMLKYNGYLTHNFYNSPDPYVLRTAYISCNPDFENKLTAMIADTSLDWFNRYQLLRLYHGVELDEKKIEIISALWPQCLKETLQEKR